MIRKDLFAVKVPFDTGSTGNSFGWCVEAIYRDRTKAHSHKRDDTKMRQMSGGPFPLCNSKVVFPSQNTVDAFLLSGNEIRS